MSEHDIPVPASLAHVFKPPQTRNGIKLSFPPAWCEEQDLLINSKARVIVAALGTKTGKTYGCGQCMSLFTAAAPRDEMGLYRIVAPIYAKSKLTFDYIDRWFLPEKLPPMRNPDGSPIPPLKLAEMRRAWESFVPDRSRHELWLRWRHNDTTIQCVHGQNPEITIEGDATQGNILDEAAKMRQQVLASVMSTTSQTGGWIRQVSTPNGLGHFHDSYRKAKEVMDWELAKGKTLWECTHLALNVPTMRSPFVKPEVIESARLFLPARIFDQLYGAQFRPDGNVFTNLEAAFGGVHEFEDLQEFMPFTIADETIFVGCDVAKKHDYMVFIAFTDKRRMLAWKRFNGIGYTESAKMFMEWLETLRVRAKGGEGGRILARFDQTGVGEAFGDICYSISRHENISLDGINWDAVNKKEAIENMMLMFEDGALDLLPWKTLSSELGLFEVSTDKFGKPSYGAPSGEHDDTVMAIALIADYLREVRGENWVIEHADPFDFRLAHYQRTGQTDEIEDLFD